MCGRYTVTRPEDIILDLDLGELDVVEARAGTEPLYNVAPTDPAPTLRQDQHQLRLETMRWGLLPFWAKDRREAARYINARCETAAAKPAFRSAFASRRCLVPSTGFYEWKTRAEPFHIGRPDHRTFAMAGLWEHWRRDDLLTFTILTTEARGPIAELHDRMPAILDRGDFAAWLDPETSVDDLQDLLRTSPRDPGLLPEPVATNVNQVRDKSASCLEPRWTPPPASQLGLF